MVKIAIVAASILPLSTCIPSQRGHVLTQIERLAAEVGARRYTDGANLGFGTCLSTDYNGDKLITCTVRDKTTGAPIELSCGYVDGMVGCRLKGSEASDIQTGNG